MNKRKPLLIGAVVACAGLILSLAAFTPATYADTTAQPEANAETETETETDAAANANTETDTTADPDLPAPTFSAEVTESQENALFHFGHNLLAIGSLLQLDSSIASGLQFAIGSDLKLASAADYSFLLGASIDYSGTTEHDLFALASSITIASDAHIDGDVYIASNALTVATDLSGDLSVATGEITLRDVTIAGNVNLSADRINFAGDVEIGGTLTYNDNAILSGDYDAAATSTYEVIEPSPAAIIAARIYSTILSVAGLFIVTIIFITLFPSLYRQLTTAPTAKPGLNLVSGLVALIAIPLIGLIAFCTIAAAPLAVIILGLYLLLIYLAQGVTGTCLGHFIIARLFKRSAHCFVEALLGIVLLNLFALIPVLGWLTGFLSLLFGLGFLVLRLIQTFGRRNPKSAKTSR